MSDSTLRQIAQLRKLSFPELQERWRSLFGGEPPAYHRRFLVKRLAYRIQELAYGGLPETTRAQMADILRDAGLDEQASIPGRGRTQKRPDDLPLAGTRLVREWNGRRYEVTVASGGFIFEGRRYRSLTAITKAITGTHWNGASLIQLLEGVANQLLLFVGGRKLAGRWGIARIAGVSHYRARRRTVHKKSAVSLCVLVLVVAALVTPTYARLNPLTTATRPAIERPAAQSPRAPSTTSASSVLILYDSSGEWGWIGQIHARLLANLLGHFPVTYRASAVESYRRGDVNRYSVTFYIGSTYDNPLPSAFVNDVMTTSKPVCWLKYNIWQLAWSKPNFSTKFGFTFNWLDWTGYDTISYNGQTFKKHQADPELGLVWVLDPTTCQVISTACRTPEGSAEECIPYIVRGGNLWYVADLPFSYITEEDRYLVFCDLLYDILGFAPPNTKRAIARIEDVDPTADPQALREIADYLYARGVPFAVSVIPVYNDPLGHYNNGVPEYARLSDEREVVNALKYMTSRGGKIILHGYTHQYDSTPNPYNGVTGDDFEFYRITLDANNQTVYANPVPEDSRRWASNRVSSGLAELKKCGLTAMAWETPHYAASAVDYQAFASKFPLTIQRVIYFDLKLPASGFKGDGDPTYFGGQFFPYVINRDLYGQKVLPENLGSYEPDPWEGYRMWLVEDILRCAEKNAALRDAWASFYFHPFYDIENLQQIVEGIQAMGYTFVPISQDLQ